MQLTTEQLLELLPNFKLDARKKNLIGPCPKCQHDEFGISLDEYHRFGCYRSKKCGFTGNILSLLKFLGKHIDTGIKTNSTQPLLNKLEKNNQEEEILSEEVPIKLPLGSYRVTKNKYLDSRGFKLYDKFQPYSTILDIKFKDYIIFPIYQNNTLRAYIGRICYNALELKQVNLKREQKGLKKLPKYKNSISEYESILLGIDEITPNTHTVILVEGLLDKENVDKQLCLDEQEEIKCLCTFKCHLSDTQLKLLLKQPNIKNTYCLYDEDVPKEKRKLVEFLKEFSNFTIHVGEWKGIDQDPGSMNQQELLLILEQASPAEIYLTKRVFNKIKKDEYTQ